MKKLLSNLGVSLELARDEAEQANLALQNARERFESIERFVNETKSVGEIRLINSEGTGNSCTVLTQFYRLDGRNVLLTITEADGMDDFTIYVGHIVDFHEKDILYACNFYYNDFELKQDLFDRLLANYSEWRFDL